MNLDGETCTWASPFLALLFSLSLSISVSLSVFSTIAQEQTKYYLELALILINIQDGFALFGIIS